MSRSNTSMGLKHWYIWTLRWRLIFSEYKIIPRSINSTDNNTKLRNEKGDILYLCTAALLLGEVITIGLLGLLGSNNVLCCCTPCCLEIGWLGGDWLVSGKTKTPGGWELVYPLGDVWCVVKVFANETEWEETLGVCRPSSESQADIFLPVLQFSSKYRSDNLETTYW